MKENMEWKLRKRNTRLVLLAFKMTERFAKYD